MTRHTIFPSSMKMMSLGRTVFGRSGKLQYIVWLSEGISGLSQHIYTTCPAFKWTPLLSIASEVLISLPLNSSMSAQVLWGRKRLASVYFVINLWFVYSITEVNTFDIIVITYFCWSMRHIEPCYLHPSIQKFDYLFGFTTRGPTELKVYKNWLYIEAKVWKITLSLMRSLGQSVTYPKVQIIFDFNLV